MPCPHGSRESEIYRGVPYQGPRLEITDFRALNLPAGSSGSTTPDEAMRDQEMLIWAADARGVVHPPSLWPAWARAAMDLARYWRIHEPETPRRVDVAESHQSEEREAYRRARARSYEYRDGPQDESFGDPF